MNPNPQPEVAPAKLPGLIYEIAAVDQTSIHRH